ncbi:MAG: c-type cytochrome [Solirubrobacterales bacterium]
MKPPTGRPIGFLAALALALLAMPAQADPSGPRKAELKAFVEQDCGSCHGMTLKGGLGKPLTKDALAEIPAEALVSAILDGRPGTPMPPWRGMVAEDEAEWIAHFLKGETDVR